MSRVRVPAPESQSIDTLDVRMTIIRTVCPHCSEPMAAEDPAGDEALRCPHCGAAMARPAVTALHANDEAAPVPAEDVAGREVARTPRRLSRAEKDRRRTLRNLLMMIVGVIVLVIAAAVLRQL